MEQHSFTYNVVHLAPYEQIEAHQQTTWELSYVLVGSGTRLIGNVVEPFSSGDVVLVPPGMPHCWDFDSNTTDDEGCILNITMTFDSGLLSSCVATFPELSAVISRLLSRKKSAVKFTGAKAEAIRSLLLDMRGLDSASQTVLVLRLILLVSDPDGEDFIADYHHISRDKERIGDAKSYILCNSHRNITLQDVASHVGMNRSSFCVFFKKTTGETFIGYLNKLRIDYACTLLKQCNCTVSEACYKAGFNDVPYFNRVFRRLIKMSPTEYVRNNL